VKTPNRLVHLVHTLDDFRDRFGPDALKTPERKPVNNWHELCACGHLDRYHAKPIGGSYNALGSRTQRVGGQPVEVTFVFGGCVGAPPNRGAETTRYSDVDREARTMTETLIPTCPCEDFVPVACVDRPNRYFSQRVPLTSEKQADPLRHPFLVGVRAFSTHLSRRRAALSDASWAAAEFDRRFVWLEQQRVCSMSRCEATDGVWPVYLIVRGVGAESDRDTVSTVLRCAKHPV
jgi:hypothetical protein